MIPERLLLAQKEDYFKYNITTDQIYDIIFNEKVEYAMEAIKGKK